MTNVNFIKYLFFAGLLLLFLGCANEHSEKGSFGYDLDFLQKYQEVITLSENDGKSQLVVLPELQGRIMTSTSNGLQGNSYGWMHYDLIASGKFEEHINPFGGEDRFWMGPEGGQYSIFFKKGTEFTFDNWYTPKELDTEAFEVVNVSISEVSFHKKMNLKNYQDFEFTIDVHRKVILFDKSSIEQNLAMKLPPEIDYVGYQSENKIVNTGMQAWSKETGLLSVWILGMYNPSKSTTVIIPYKDSLSLNTAYFGDPPAGRLTTTDTHILFKGDGTARFKVGLPPHNILPFIGSYDAKKQILTVVHYSFHGDTTYVNSMWSHQEKPYAGDVVNSYNDGPLDNGQQLGPFYELESSSSTRELQPNEFIEHTHATYHFEGDFEALNAISKQLLLKDLSELN
ncbi:DUF6786 family protein [Maribacter sp. HTCC2170]|uniref:DUF6786 family protein n=1 Tax=Maribacter sp. (strain HTCC2170 / KCCM 42371) TaxID=313603 RepID=UPI00006AFCDD|nr:DUF6786 family protein [Maribacter sp. HTCC2170]EAR01318.1 hypothetical protein FB2170_11376 [Maribacter sp. HTCC2170]